MTEPDDIQKIIRLKRHELPPEGFIDDFVKSFQHRQRAEMLQNSARTLLWERVTTYFDDLMTPKWGWAMAAVLALLGTAYTLKPAGKGQIAERNIETFAVREVSADIKQPTDERFLISQHYNGGLADETQKLQPQGSMTPVRLDVNLQPR